MKHVNVNVDQMQVLVIINSVKTTINVDVNVKNYLMKAYVVNNIFGILAIVNVNVINRVILVSTQTMKIWKKVNRSINGRM